MVNLDTLALGPTEVWASRSDKKLVQEARGLAAGMKLPLYPMNVDQVGESDEESFIDKKIPTITFHTVTSKTFPWLHTKKDNMDAVQFEDYYQTYQLLAGYLALLDHDLEVPSASPNEKP